MEMIALCEAPLSISPRYRKTPKERHFAGAASWSYNHGYFRDRLGAQAVAESKHKDVINPNLMGSSVNSILRDRSTIRFLHTPLDSSITRAHDDGVKACVWPSWRVDLDGTTVSEIPGWNCPVASLSKNSESRSKPAKDRDARIGHPPFITSDSTPEVWQC
jgi:hypothetical protein